MKQLNLDRINDKAPYKVSINGKQFVFETQYGLHYEIRFFEELPIGGCETWQFSFAKAEDIRTPEDPYVRFTLFAVIDEFFTENENVMLYILIVFVPYEGVSKADSNINSLTSKQTAVIII